MKIRDPKKYGWIPQLPDARDIPYKTTMGPQLPPMVNLQPLVSRVYDQGQLGSCTSNAINQAMMIGLAIEKQQVINPSRLFLYYNERVIEGDPGQDNGAVIRDGMKSANVQGVCLDEIWPYDISKFAVQPPVLCYKKALENTISQYLAVQQDLTNMRACIAAGFPFVFGFTVYESFENIDGEDTVGKYGNCPMPNLQTESVLGGHAVCCVGYNDGPRITLPNSHGWPSHSFLCQNSWGTDWGLKSSALGCFTIPYSYLANPNLASDFWTIRFVT